MAEILSVNVKFDDKIFKIGVDEDDIYSEGDGTIMITINWEKIAFDAIRRLVDICNIDISNIDVVENESVQNPPEYTNEVGECTREHRTTTPCVLCDGEVVGYGNNPQPLKEDGRCCEDCNDRKVIPERQKKTQKN